MTARSSTKKSVMKERSSKKCATSIKQISSDGEQDDEYTEEEMMAEILNNTAAKLLYEDEHYYFLIRKKSNSSQCMMYLTDLSDNFWIEKMSYIFLQEMKTQMKVRTGMKSFVEYLVAGMKEEMTIITMDPHPKLRIRMKICDGLVMNCRIEFDAHLSVDKKPAAFKSLLKFFGGQLFEAMEVTANLNQKCNRPPSTALKGQSAEPVKEKYMEEAEYRMQTIFGHKQNKIQPEKRDLINPLRKKRRGQGMKIVRPEPTSLQQNESQLFQDEQHSRNSSFSN